MNMYYRFIIFITLCNDSYVYSMEAIEIPDEKSIITINNRDELTAYIQSKNGAMPTKEELERINIPATFMAELVTSITLNRDTPTPMHATMTKSMRSLQETNDASIQRQKKAIITKAMRFDGDLSSATLDAKKKENATLSARTLNEDTTQKNAQMRKELIEKAKERESAGSSPNLPKASLKLNLESIHTEHHQGRKPFDPEIFYDEEYAAAKQEMRELLLRAAEAAISEENTKARRNKIFAALGGLTTLISTVAGPIITYFTTETDCSCGDNSTNTQN